jgi:hypothetical protein
MQWEDLPEELQKIFDAYKKLSFADEVSLPEVMRYCERLFVRVAMKCAEGKPSVAARLLGMKHQSLIHTLNARHQDIPRAEIIRRGKNRDKSKQSVKKSRKKKS